MSLNTGWIEKRQHERKAANWDLVYQVIDAEEADALCRKYQKASQPSLETEGQADSKAVTCDLSMGGLSIAGSRLLSAGTKLLLYVHPPSFTFSLKVVAEVLYCALVSDGGGNPYRSGMRIMGMDDESFHQMLDSI